MMLKIAKYFVLALAFFASHVCEARKCRPVELQCEHLTAPLGIDSDSPRLSWRLDDSRKAACQTAYQIVVSTDSAAVASGEVWNSGKVESADCLVSYQGKPLAERTRYWWRVSIWDKDGKLSHSDITFFETGLKGVWKGAWISDANDVDFRPAPYFRKEFQADPAKTLVSARAYICSAGLYELTINGRKVGDHQLDPMYTRFDRRLIYVSHDITAMVKEGSNAVGVLLGNGWYNHQAIAVWNFHDAPWRGRPTFCMDIYMAYSDGSSQLVKTDESWLCSSKGPLLYNNIYTGEHYDASCQMKGWDMAGFDDSEWEKVSFKKAPAELIVSQQMVPIRDVDVFKPKRFTKFSDRNYLFDMGQNMSGTSRIRLKGERGTELRIIHGERLGKDGHVDLSNIDVYYRGDHRKEPFQTDILILSGEEDEFMARFNYKGFRYVEVISDAPVALDENSLTASFRHSDVKPAGKISSSSELINKLYRATNNAYLSNLMGYPTDCPQREKNGWTGDGHLAIETALYNFDGITVYEKWLADHRDEQRADGVIPDIVPTGGWGYTGANGLDWTSTIAIIPWQIYMFYGDSHLLKECYPNIKRYVDYVESISRDGLTSFGRGDWVPVSVGSNLELTSSCYFYVDACILAKAAGMFGYERDRQKYSALAVRIKDSINRKYYDKRKGIYASGTQTELSVPLHWGVCPEEERHRVASNLNRKVIEAGYHLDVGVLGAKALLDALNDNGYQYTAYRVATQNTYPSWGWWIVNGATTLLENWDLEATRDISDNHMMFGEIGAYMYKGLGGIKPDPETPGFKNILMNPYFPDDLEHFEASHESPYGMIVSEWRRKKGKIIYTLTIPAGATARLTLPGVVKPEIPESLTSGTWRFTVNPQEKKIDKD